MGERAAAVVPDPELEVWVWVESPELIRVIGWREGDDVKAWVAERGLAGEPKPERPKEAWESVRNTEVLVSDLIGWRRERMPELPEDQCSRPRRAGGHRRHRRAGLPRDRPGR